MSRRRCIEGGCKRMATVIGSDLCDFHRPPVNVCTDRERGVPLPEKAEPIEVDSFFALDRWQRRRVGDVS
jgi:hypothetical protein